MAVIVTSFSSAHAVTQGVSNASALPATVVALTDGEGNLVPSPTVATSGEQSISAGGNSTAAIAAAKASNTVVKATAGRLCRVLITTAPSSGATSIYDNAATNSGTVIGVIPSTATVGQVFDFQLPAVNGITVGGLATAAGMTISYY